VNRTLAFSVLILAIGVFIVLPYQTPQIQTYKDTLKTRFSFFVEKILLPYRLVRLSTEEPDNELIIPIEDLKLRSISDSWGAPRSGGRTHEGIDMFAKKGTPVYSATHGYVVYAGTNPLGGNVLFILGRGGVRYYYAHLDSFAEGMTPGKEVSTTTLVGFVGNTGNAERTPPHLHFGMYKNGAQNPYSLLVPR
jgi:peptidoglycan LD-endopeptidase LytH